MGIRSLYFNKYLSVSTVRTVLEARIEQWGKKMPILRDSGGCRVKKRVKG